MQNAFGNSKKSDNSHQRQGGPVQISTFLGRED